MLQGHQAARLPRVRRGGHQLQEGRAHATQRLQWARAVHAAASGERTVRYIQMQLCDKTMRHWLDEPGRDATLDTTRPIFLQILRALRHIHSCSRIHRDLTPHNVLLDDHGQAKVSAFGLSRKTARRMSKLPGNVKYIAPELMTGQ